MSHSLLAQIYYEDENILIEHTGECKIPGYFILRLKEACTSLSALDDEICFQVMGLLKTTHKIIEAVIKPEQIYLCSFCEVNPQLHYHLFPRTQELTRQYLKAHDFSIADAIDGPHLFKWAREHYDCWLDEKQLLQLRQAFQYQFENEYISQP